MLKTETMAIHAFRVVSREGETEKLSHLLEAIQKDKLESRYRQVGFTPVRIESIQRDNDTWLLDIVRFRENHGPGKAARDTQTKGFSFDDGEEFSEETACLYNSTSRLLFLQSNYHGVKNGKLESYFSNYRRDKANSYKLEPCLLEKADAFQRRQKSRSFEVQVDLRQLDYEAVKKYDANLIKAAYAHGQPLSNTLTINLGVGRGKGWLPPSANELLSKLYHLFIEHPASVKKLQANILPPESDTCELVDLVAHRWKHEVAIDQGEDKRFPRSERFRHLQIAYNSYSDDLL